MPRIVFAPTTREIGQICNEIARISSEDGPAGAPAFSANPAVAETGSVTWGHLLPPVALLALLAAALLLLRLPHPWYAVALDGSSMAPALPGPHYELRCRDCHATFRVGQDRVEPGRVTVCPNCGFGENPVELGQWRPAPTAWLAPRSGTLRRFDLVAFRQGEEFMVKRLIGLPGERIELHEGDVWVNGRPVVKSLDQLRQVAVRVHDSRYATGSDVPARWRSPGGLWWSAANGYQTRGGPDGQLAWLEYENWSGMGGASPPLPRTRAVPVYDHYGWNHRRSRSDLAAVTDLLLDLDVRPLGPGDLVIRLVEDEVRLRVGRGTLVVEGGSATSSGRTFSHLRQLRVSVAACDGRLTVEVNGRLALVREVQASNPSPYSLSHPCAVGAGGPVILERLVLSRDLFYRGPRGERHWWAPRRLESHEYLVLGDNVPLSIDSRYPQIAVTRENLLGRARPGSRLTAD